MNTEFLLSIMNAAIQQGSSLNQILSKAIDVLEHSHAIIPIVDSDNYLPSAHFHKIWKVREGILKQTGKSVIGFNETLKGFSNTQEPLRVLYTETNPVITLWLDKNNIPHGCQIGP